ncbi:FAD-dependent oxidoreductase [Vibrio sp. HN007]|uniref:glycerol-3-phosphate dehydrogenase/oxidase n=1 Tax=Vibrio iocasae TaxID=3098914 RepID=UPI0035D4138F
MRRASLQQLEGITFDLVVVGGGITGAAIARDAALRGLKVILVEKEDFASGTSSRSSKLIHGGLRYLETYQFGLVAESVRERELALRLAPHLTKVQPFLYMFYDNTPDKKWLLNLGLTFYDFVSGNWNKRRHKMLSKEQVLKRQPQFRAEGLLGAAMFYDVSTDDARVTIDTVKSAAEHGAQVLNHCEVTGLTYSDNKCDGVQVRDTLTGVEQVIKGHYVVNSTGPWSDNVLRFEKPDSKVLRPTKGVHIVLRKKDFPLHSAIFMRSPDDGRVVWPIPSTQDDRVFIGTTDTTYDGDLNDVHPEKEDIRYLLNVANHLMPEAKLTEDHVIGSWAGLRPLIAPKDDLNNSKTPREHQIMQSDSGIFSIIGGKLTSNRVMAKQLLDAVVKHDQYKYLAPDLVPYSASKIGISGSHPEPDKPLKGKKPYSKNMVISGLEEKGIPTKQALVWASRYGYNAFKVAEYWLSDEALRTDLSKRGLTSAEIHYCVKEEAACSLKDVLVRRTSEFFWDNKGGLEKVGLIAQEMQELLGWAEEEKLSQIDAYYDLVCKHRPVHVEKPQLQAKTAELVKE